MKMGWAKSFSWISVCVVLSLVIVGVVVADSHEGETLHVRPVRQAPKPDPKNPMNLAPDVDEDYPIVFNIILFLAVTLILALIAICVAIASMDPGRDSLIYRVTSAQRFKKDN